MAKSVLDIVIRTIKEGGADKETISGLVTLKKSIMDAAAVGGMLVTAGYAIEKAFSATVVKMVDYADKVRTVQNATGATAEDSSKLIQILDDQKISYEQLEKAIAKNSKAYDFSIEGIARMSDEYLALGNAQQQADFMQKRFGKSWIDFVPIMQQGSAAIRDSADAVSEKLILDQRGVDAAREYEIAIDNLNDSWDGFAITAGSKALPAVNTFVDGLNVFVRSVEIAAEKGGMLRFAFWNIWKASDEAAAEVAAGKQGMNEHAAATEDDSAALAENAARLKEVSAAHQSMLGLIVNVANENKNFADKQADLTLKMQENRAEAESLYPYQLEQLGALDQKYADMEATYAANAAAHNAAMGKIQYDLLVTKLSVDGITDAEFAMIQQAGLMFGVFDTASVTAAQSMNAVAQAVTDGKLRVQDVQAALDMLAGGTYQIDVILNTLQNIAQGKQAMSGGGSMMAAPSYNAARGYAEGGIATGPATGHWELLHGTEAVIPLQNGSVPVQMQGGQSSGGGNSNINVQLTISSPVTILDQQTVQTTLMPFIINGVREARARGAL